MADELTVNITASLTNGDLKRLFSATGVQIDQAAKGAIHICQNVGTSEEVIISSEIGTLGWCCLRNLDSTNYVDYGPDSGGSMVNFGSIKAGEPAAFRLKPGITFKAKADTAAVELDILILED